MRRQCGGAHEISGIKTPIFLHGWGGLCWGGRWWDGWWSLWCEKKNHYPPRWICMPHIWFPTEFPRGIIIFQWVLTKFYFLMKFPHLEKIVNLMKNRSSGPELIWYFGKEANGLVAQLIYSGTIKSS